MYLLTGLWSSDTDYFFSRIRITLPFLILPFAFTTIRFQSRKHVKFWLLIFFLLTVISSVWAFIQYYFQYRSFSIVFDTGTRFPVPINHVRFSLMVSFSVFIGAYLFDTFERFWIKTMVLIASVFLIIFLHLLSVRSGILGFYLAGLYFVIYKIRGFGLRRNHGILILIFPLLFLLTYQNIPAFKHKVDITKKSLFSLIHNYPIENKSDSGRIVSVLGGIQLGKENIWTGVGLGDIKAKMRPVFPKKEPLLPHNQFVFVFAVSGIIGALWFTIVIIFPFIFLKGWKYCLFSCFIIIILTSFLFDHTLETQRGVGFFLFFELYLIKMVGAIGV